MVKNIGLKVKAPEKECDDPKCPFHGNLKVRGRVFQGTVTSDKMSKTVTVKKTRLYYVRKYKRYEKRISTFKAHNPPCIGAKVGDVVKIAETRPLSKTKSFVVVEIVKRANAEKE
ncbi:MAG: small subunit ribosomal protein [Candidatus Woesearchaeota archaeon]|nr:small subunit ribosomal protein [Candidatus Woesearchaeota archaeon]MDN5327985.1 small subunit ribosomal protein [Candidatus Woesearchaeota archaeon]